MALEALKDIRQAEKKTEELIRKARTVGEKDLLAVEGARAKAIEEARLKGKKTVQEKISQASKDAQKKVEEIRSKGKKEIEDIKGRANSKMEKAVKIVLNRLY